MNIIDQEIFENKVYEDLLNVDLNKIANDSVIKSFKVYLDEIKNLSDKVSVLTKENIKVKEELNENKLNNSFVSLLSNAYLNIKETPANKEGYGERSLDENRFEFFKDLMKLIFNIKGTNYFHQACWSFKTLVVTAFYEHKEEAIMLYKILYTNSCKNNQIEDDSAYIKRFQMPFDYSREFIVNNYLLQPGIKYNTNGAVEEIGYWEPQWSGYNNIPHFLILKNKIFAEDDIIEMVINDINAKIPNYEYLFLLTKYNKYIKPEQIKKIGDCLLHINFTQQSYCNKYISDFVCTSIKYFSQEVIDYLYDLYKKGYNGCPNWKNFPTEYQEKYLMNCTFKELIDAMENYRYDWSIEKKEELLKKYFLQHEKDKK